MQDDQPGLFSHPPAEPEPYAVPADTNQPLFLTAAAEPDPSAPPEASAG